MIPTSPIPSYADSAVHEMAVDGTRLVRHVEPQLLRELTVANLAFEKGKGSLAGFNSAL